MLTPIGGVLMELARDASGMPIADGQLVSQGFQVARIAPVDSLVADIDLVGPELAPGTPRPERAAPPTSPGRTSPSKAPSSASPPKSNRRPTTFRAEVAINNPGGLLRPGMFVEVTPGRRTAHRRAGGSPARRSPSAAAGGSCSCSTASAPCDAKSSSVSATTRSPRSARGLRSASGSSFRGLETLTDGTRVRVSG